MYTKKYTKLKTNTFSVVLQDRQAVSVTAYNVWKKKGRRWFFVWRRKVAKAQWFFSKNIFRFTFFLFCLFLLNFSLGSLHLRTGSFLLGVFFWFLSERASCSSSVVRRPLRAWGFVVLLVALFCFSFWCLFLVCFCLLLVWTKREFLRRCGDVCGPIILVAKFSFVSLHTIFSFRFTMAMPFVWQQFEQIPERENTWFLRGCWLLTCSHQWEHQV